MTDLELRLQHYLAAGDPAANPNPDLYASALSSSSAAAAAASASLISTHTRVLRPEPVPSFVPPGRHELDFLAADKPEEHPATQADGEPAEQSSGQKLPLRPGCNSLDALVKGAAGIAVLKARHE
ncbi:MAG TPA: hypothetical protein VFT60_04790 [Bryobacteraceae bacterium]|nr:hypothetical protein [Bryobacteraceae bacterium]